MKGAADIVAPRGALLDSSRRRKRRWWIGAGVAAVLVLHGLYWYAPREVAAEPSPPFESLLAGNTGDAGKGVWDRVVWIARPHQNLGEIDRAVGSLDDYLDELGRVAELSAPAVPRFGPFTVPPAHEIAIAWSEDGKRRLAAARVYRAVGLLARLAGHLAGNSWLAGGEATSGSKSYRVRWEGSLWIVESGDGSSWEACGGASGDGHRGKKIAEARVARPLGVIPAGRFELFRGDDGLEIRGGELPGESATSEGTSPGHETLSFDLPDLALWVAVAEPGPTGGPGLFLLWEETESVLPRVAVLQRGEGRAFHLPGESLLELFGRAEPAFRLGWSVRGTDRKARREGFRAVPWLERNYPMPPMPQLPPQAGRRRSAGAWLAAAGRIEPRRAARLLGRLAGELRKFPLTPAREIERAEAAVRLLAPFADCPRLTYAVWRDPDGIRARLCPGAGEEALRLESSGNEDDQIDEQP